MSDNQGKIVVGVDGSAPADAALHWAIRQAELTGETVEAVMAWEFPVIAASYGWAPVVVSDNVDLRAIADKTLDEAISRATGADCNVKVERTVIEGYPPAVLVEQSADADLLVVGSRGHGTFAEALLGSVSQHCSHHA